MLGSALFSLDEVDEAEVSEEQLRKEYYPFLGPQPLSSLQRLVNPYIHSQALVEGEVGEGTRVWAWAHVMEGAKVGKNCNIGEHVFVEAGAIIGDNCIIKNGVQIWENIIIEDNVFIASGVVFTNEKYTRSGYRREHLTTYVKKGATIGAGAVILPGLEIGEYATIGAGSVVTVSVISNALVYGNPATQRGWVCSCGVKLIKDHYDFYNCQECPKRYMAHDGGLFLVSIHEEAQYGLSEPLAN